jgi:hypothetical protein
LSEARNRKGGPTEEDDMKSLEKGGGDVDLKSSSLKDRFRFMKIYELNPKSGSRFGEICP